MVAALIELRGAGVRIGQRTILDAVDLSVATGEVVGLLGPNGSGKTTAARACLGLLPLQSGAALLQGRAAGSLRPAERARIVAYLPQQRGAAWPIAVRDAVALGRFAYGTALGKLAPADEAAVDRAIHDCALEALTDRAVTSLSGGEAARVHVARALAAHTPALIADEPIAALDPLHQWGVMRVLAGYGATGGGALVVLHDIAMAAQFCTRIILMKAGRVIASGPPAQTLTAAALREAYGIEAELVSDGGRLLFGIGGPAGMADGAGA